MVEIAAVLARMPTGFDTLLTVNKIICWHIFLFLCELPAPRLKNEFLLMVELELVV